MDIFLVISMIIFIVCVYFDNKEKSKEIDKLQKRNEELSVDKNILQHKLDDAYYELNQKALEYKDELMNFKKVIKAYGKQQIDCIPYVKQVSKQEDKFFTEIREDYIIPEIHISFGYGCRRGEYDLEKKIEEDE
ncbi:MAG: hypothetical protein ACI3T9_03800 [Romboutsia timonensis]